MLRPYPTTIAPEAWQVIADAATGTLPKPAYALHCAYEAGGFVLGKLLPDGGEPQAAAGCTGARVADCGPHCTRDEAINHMRELAKFPQAKAQAVAIPWLSILKVILDILGKLPLDPAPTPAS